MDHIQDMERLRRLAASPGARDLAKALERRGGESLRTALDQAAGGDYTQAKQALSQLLQDPQIRALLEQLGGSL